MSGWAAWGAVVAVLYTANRAFSTYRRQKQEDRRIEAADHILTFAYKFKRTMQGVRSPGILGFELTRAEQRLKESWKGWDQKAKAEQQQIITAQAMWGRLQDNKDTWAQIFEVMPRARALFGDEAEAQLQAFWTAYVQMETACDMYAEDSGNDPEFTKNLRGDMWSHSKGDPVAKIVDEAVARLEELLLSVIRADYKPTKPP